MADPEGPLECQRIFGCGKIYNRKPRREGLKPQLEWAVTSKAEVEKICLSILPYLRLKRKREEALWLLEVVRKGPRHNRIRLSLSSPPSPGSLFHEP